MKVSRLLVFLIVGVLCVLVITNPLVMKIFGEEDEEEPRRGFYTDNFSGRISADQNKMNGDFLPYDHRLDGYVEVRDLKTFRIIYYVDYPDLNMMNKPVFYDSGVLFSYYTDESRYRYIMFDGRAIDLKANHIEHVICEEEPIFIVCEDYRAYKKQITATQNDEILWKFDGKIINVSDEILWSYDGKTSIMIDLKTGKELAQFEGVVVSSSKQISILKIRNSVSINTSYDYHFVDNTGKQVFYKLENIQNLLDIFMFTYQNNIIIFELLLGEYTSDELQCNVVMVNTDSDEILDNMFIIQPAIINCVSRNIRPYCINILDATDKLVAISLGGSNELLIYDFASGNKIFETNTTPQTTFDRLKYIYGDFVLIDNYAMIYLFDYVRDEVMWIINKTPIRFYREFDGLGYYIYQYDTPISENCKTEIIVRDINYDKIEPFKYRFEFRIEENDFIPTKHGIIILQDAVMHQNFIDKVYLFRPGSLIPIYSIKGDSRNQTVEHELQDNGDYIKLMYKRINCEECSTSIQYLEIKTGRMYSETQYPDQQSSQTQQKP